MSDEFDYEFTIQPSYAQTDVNGNPIDDEQREQLREHLSDDGAPDFTKSNWKTAESRDAWKDVLNRAKQGMKEAEWRSVLDDETDRKAAIVHINNRNREKWLRRVSQHDLAYRDVMFSEANDGYSHKFKATDRYDPTRQTYSVIAVNDDVADQMEESILGSGFEHEDTVGRLLGFPKCCRDFFFDQWHNEGHIDPIYEITCNTDSVEMVDGDPEHLRVVDPSAGANIMWRYFGLSFITHLPCAWDCEESIEIARDRYRIMAENGYKEAADALYQWLEAPATWSGLHSQALIKNEHFIGKSKTSLYPNKKRIIWGEQHETGSALDDGGKPPEEQE